MILEGCTVRDIRSIFASDYLTGQDDPRQWDIPVASFLFRWLCASQKL